MIVYLVKRAWFTKHEEANTYRRSAGPKPAKLHKVTVTNREELAALLNALCEPLGPPVAGTVVMDLPADVVVNAYIEPSLDVPDYVPRFLLDPEQRKIWDERNA